MLWVEYKTKFYANLKDFKVGIETTHSEIKTSKTNKNYFYLSTS